MVVVVLVIVVVQHCTFWFHCWACCLTYCHCVRVVVVVPARLQAPGVNLASSAVLLGIYSTFVMAGGGGWGGGDDDDIGTQTPRTISPQGPFYSVFTVIS